MYAYNVFLNNVRKYDVKRNAKSIVKRLYIDDNTAYLLFFRKLIDLRLGTENFHAFDTNVILNTEK